MMDFFWRVMFKKILYAADLGAFTSHALIHVESLAKSFDAEVVVVHAVPPLGEFAASVVKSHCSESAKKEVLGTLRIEGLLDTLSSEVYDILSNNAFIDGSLIDRVSGVFVAPGHPASIILYEAERLGVDLIVIGSHGTESLDGRLLGSVASKVLQLAKVPVFMIPMMNPAHALGMTEVPIPTRFGT